MLYLLARRAGERDACTTRTAFAADRDRRGAREGAGGAGVRRDLLPRGGGRAARLHVRDADDRAGAVARRSSRSSDPVGALSVSRCRCTFDGMVEIIADGAVNYLDRSRRRSVGRAYLAELAARDASSSASRKLFDARAARAARAGAALGRAGAAAGAGAAGAGAARIASSTRRSCCGSSADGREAAPAVAEQARQSCSRLIRRSRVLVQRTAAARAVVADAAALTAARRGVDREVMWAAGDHDAIGARVRSSRSSPGSAGTSSSRPDSSTRSRGR